MCAHVCTWFEGRTQGQMFSLFFIEMGLKHTHVSNKPVQQAPGIPRFCLPGARIVEVCTITVSSLA